MTIQTICEAIAEIGKMIDGIESSYPEAPLSLDTARLPALYAFAGAATYDWKTEGDETGIVSRQYRVHVALSPLAQKDSIAVERDGKDLLESVVRRFAGRPSLGNTQGVQSSLVKSDTSVVILPEYSGKFIGFEVALLVDEIIDRDIEDYDY